MIAGVRKSCTLWLGGDHLLIVFSTHFNQEFKRFYLRDIQALTIRKTNSATIWTGGFLALAATFGLISLGVSDTVGLWVLWSIAGVFAFFAILNALGGNSCIAEIKTAVQTEELSSLKRLRKAQKTFSILRPLIEEAQGKLTSEQIAAEAGAALQRAGDQPPGLTRPLSSEPLKPCSGRIHQLLFLLMLLDGLIAASSIYFRHITLIVGQSILMLAVAGLAITALIKQYQTDLADALRRLTWTATIYIVISYFISLGETIALSAGDPAAGHDQWALFEKFSQLNPLETPWLLWILIFNIVGSLVLGALGTMLIKRFRDRRKLASVPPALKITPEVVP